MEIQELTAEVYEAWLEDVFVEDARVLQVLAKLTNEVAHGYWWTVRQQLLVIASGIHDLERRRALARYALIISCNEVYFSSWASAARPLCEMALDINFGGHLQEIIAAHSDKPTSFWRNL